MNSISDIDHPDDLISGERYSVEYANPSRGERRSFTGEFCCMQCPVFGGRALYVHWIVTGKSYWIPWKYHREINRSIA